MMTVKLFLLVIGPEKSPCQVDGETTEDSRWDINNEDKNGIIYSTAR